LSSGLSWNYSEISSIISGINGKIQNPCAKPAKRRPETVQPKLFSEWKKNKGAIIKSERIPNKEPIERITLLFKPFFMATGIKVKLIIYVIVPTVINIADKDSG
jgi:hypothetical protein